MAETESHRESAIDGADTLADGAGAAIRKPDRDQTHGAEMPTIDFGHATAARLRECRRSGAWIRMRDGRKVAYPLGGLASLRGRSAAGDTI